MSPSRNMRRAQPLSICTPPFTEGFKNRHLVPACNLRHAQKRFKIMLQQYTANRRWHEGYDRLERPQWQFQQHDLCKCQPLSQPVGDALTCSCFQVGHQQGGQEEVAQVVGLQLHIEAILRGFLRQSHHSCSQSRAALLQRPSGDCAQLWHMGLFAWILRYSFRMDSNCMREVRDPLECQAHANQRT